MTTSDLLAELSRPDPVPERWAELVERHGDRLWAVARAAAGNALAEDAFQEGLLAIRQRAGRFRPGADPETSALAWMVTVVHRRAIDLVRREARRTNREGAAMSAEPVAPPAASEEPAIAAHAVMRALGQLPERHQRVIRLRLLGGLDAAQTASVLGCPAEQVRVRLHRALELLRRRCGALVAVMPSLSGLELCLQQASSPAVTMPPAVKATAIASFTRLAPAAGLSPGIIMTMSAGACAILATFVISLAMPWRSAHATEASPPPTAAPVPIAGPAAPSSASMATAATHAAAAEARLATPAGAGKPEAIADFSPATPDMADRLHAQVTADSQRPASST
jgi:RNA polymerase sigma-70 factor (ECF subfamily)